jgi:hypothetical protein
MREFIKGVLLVGLLTAGIAAAMGWIEDRPEALGWSLRIGGVVVAIVFFALFLRMHFQPDLVPDLLRETCGGYFEKNGLCFAIQAVVENETCCLLVHFQNRYARACRGEIALRPARGFFMRRGAFPTIKFAIECPAAGFGVVRVPLAIPGKLQGKKQTLEIGATVQYPKGRGRMLRFRDGGLIRTNAEFVNSFGNLLTAAGALTGHFVSYSPATLTFTLPIGVAEELPSGSHPMTEMLWEWDGQELF